LNGNVHDLDYVLEKGGAVGKLGMPVAFIETAWRRYTKHSRNKAQEIQGAIIPLVETYRNSRPFMGAILAGEFTSGALTQLRSLGFTVLYFSYSSVVDVFRKHGIPAAFDEHTPDAELQKKVDLYERKSPDDREAIAKALLTAHAKDVAGFIKSLKAAVSRQIERIIVLPLHGSPRELATVADAMNFIIGYDDHDGGGLVHRYEILIRYNNGDKIEG